jgi:hypothetical protein
MALTFNYAPNDSKNGSRLYFSITDNDVVYVDKTDVVLEKLKNVLNPRATKGKKKQQQEKVEPEENDDDEEEEPKKKITLKKFLKEAEVVTPPAKSSSKPPGRQRSKPPPKKSDIAYYIYQNDDRVQYPKISDLTQFGIYLNDLSKKKGIDYDKLKMRNVVFYFTRTLKGLDNTVLNDILNRYPGKFQFWIPTNRYRN